MVKENKVSSVSPQAGSFPATSREMPGGKKPDHHRMHREGKMKSIAITGMAVSLMVAGTAVAGMFTSGPNLLEARCAVCHPSSKIKVLKRSPGQWDAIVAGMMKKGAILTSSEKKTLVDYLAKTYKP
jgi:hypothetical protein